MPGSARRRPGFAAARSFGVSICLALLLPLTSMAQSADEAALRQLAERFYAAANSDLNTIQSLVSAKSPRLAEWKEIIGKTTAGVRSELKKLTIEGITVEGDKASVRVVVDMTITDLKTGSVVFGPGRPLKRDLRCVREGDTWKVWDSQGAERDVSIALVNAKTDEERKAALAIAREMPIPIIRLLVVSVAGRDSAQQKYPQALSLYEAAMDMATQAGDKKVLGYALSGIARIKDLQGNYKTALEYYERSLRIEEELGDNPQIAWLNSSIGRIHHIQGDYPKAIECYERVFKIRQATGDTAGLARLLSDIGSLHLSQGNHAAAMETLQKSLALTAGNVAEKSVTANTLSNLGFAYSFAGNRIMALESFQRALNLQEELGEKSSVAGTLLSIGDVHRVQGNEAQALYYYQAALKIGKEIDNKKLISDAIGSLGNLQYASGNYSRGLEYHLESLRIAEQVPANSTIWVELFNVGLFHQLLGNTTEALEYHQRSLKICEQMQHKEGIATTLYGLGSVYLDRGEYSKAVELANRGIAVSKAGGPLARRRDLYSVAGKAYRGLNQFEQARQAFENAIAVVEELRMYTVGGTQEQQRFLAIDSFPYYDMVDLLVSQRNTTDAFGFAERVKGRALLDTLQSGRDNITGSMTRAEQEEEHKLTAEINSVNIQITREKVREQPDQARLADLGSRLQKARLDQERFQINLYAAHPELRVHRGQMQPISLEEAGKLIPDKETALLEYVVGKEKTQLFVLTGRPEAKGEQPAAAPILKVYTIQINEKELADRVAKFRGRLANQDYLFHEPARELYDLLLGPAHADLQNKTNLIIVPDGVLWELPFQALQPTPMRFLIENCTISYAPSLTVLLEMSKSHSTVAVQSPKLLALGNPAIGQQTTKRITSVLMDERLGPLPEAERQVKELAKLYGPQRSRIYVGPEAQEARVKTEAAGYGILHLAAHGILNDKNPMYSQVVLSQPEGDISEDGMLEAWEIMNMDLKADLVVLSACETARGRIGSGEGMIGLTWAFFVAGVPTIAASQWSVDSASTTELMVEFHRNLERHKSKAESLRLAMLKLLKSKEYSRPFYWAGFVVVGNGR